jgi:hypothetical protein
MNVFSDHFINFLERGHIQNPCVWVSHGIQGSDDLLINGKFFIVQIKGILILKIVLSLTPIEKLGSYSSNYYPSNTNKGRNNNRPTFVHSAPPCGEKIVVNPIYHTEGLFIYGEMGGKV